MENVLKIIDLGKKGISGPLDFFVIILSIFIVLIPAVLNLNKIISLNEFDRLFIPKHERNVQQFVQKVFDYLMFCAIYLASGFVLSFFLNTKTLNGQIGNLFVNGVLLTFGLTFLIISPKVIINGWFKDSDYKLVRWIRKTYEKRVLNWVFHAQLVLGFIVYTFFYGKPEINLFYVQYKYYIMLFFFPCFLLYIYRTYHKRNLYEYRCQVITEEIFNAAKPIIKYSLDQDKTVFSSTGDNVLFLYDKSCNMYFKFDKKDKESS